MHACKHRHTNSLLTLEAARKMVSEELDNVVARMARRDMGENDALVAKLVCMFDNLIEVNVAFRPCLLDTYLQERDGRRDTAGK